MSSSSASEVVLVPIEILEGETLDEDLATLLSTLDVVILGYHKAPEQTPPSQMRQQFEERAETALDSVALEIEDQNGSVTQRLVFTHDVEQSIERIAAEVGATAIVHPNPQAPPESLLLVLGLETDAARVATFTAKLRGERDFSITLLAGPETTSADSAVEALEANGVPPDAIAVRSVEAQPFIDAIIDTAIDHDVTIMGTARPDWRSLLLGDMEERIAAESLGPVIEVRTPESEPDG